MLTSQGTLRNHYSLPGFPSTTDIIRNYNIVSRAVQSNSAYVSVVKIPIVHADNVSKSRRQKLKRDFFKKIKKFLFKLQ